MNRLPTPIPIDLQHYEHYLMPRERDAHKGQLGHVLVVGGAPGMSGAVRLAGEAALRVGAGRVSIATHVNHASTLNLTCPELMCHGIESLEQFQVLLQRATVIAIGPGLGRDAWGRSLLECSLEITDRPMVFDADALFHLPHIPYTAQAYHIFTPHPGEAAYLLNQSTENIQKDRRQSLQELINHYSAVMVLKGQHSLIGEGQQSYLCHAGNPGMATAGMGDVLTGIIAGLCAQKIPALDASCLGVLLHAMAGDRAAQHGERGMIASDLFPFLRPLVNTLAI